MISDPLPIIGSGAIPEEPRTCDRFWSPWMGLSIAFSPHGESVDDTLHVLITAMGWPGECVKPIFYVLPGSYPAVDREPNLSGVDKCGLSLASVFSDTRSSVLLFLPVFHLYETSLC